MPVETLVESLAKSVTTSMDQGPRLSDATRARLVWHVAIAGFVLVNLKALTDALATTHVDPQMLLVAAIPLLLAVALSLVAHFLTDRADMARTTFFVSKLSLIDMHLNKVRQGQPDSSEFGSILQDTSPALVPLKSKADSLAGWVNSLELLSLASILVGLGAAIIIPILDC